MVLVDSEIGQLNALTADNGAVAIDGFARIYWSDSEFQRIESMFLDGTNRQVVINKGLTTPSSIAVLGNHIYWIDLYNKVIERADRWTGDNYELILDNLDDLQEIRIMSGDKQNFFSFTEENEMNSQNPCGVYNGGCSHLCLFRPHGYICSCPSYIETSPCSTVPGEMISHSSSNENSYQQTSNITDNSAHKGPQTYGTTTPVTISGTTEHVNMADLIVLSSDHLSNEKLNQSLPKELNPCSPHNGSGCEWTSFLFDGKSSVENVYFTNFVRFRSTVARYLYDCTHITQRTRLAVCHPYVHLQKVSQV